MGIAGPSVRASSPVQRITLLPMTDVLALRDAYDAQLRGASGFGAVRVDTDGPLTRVTGGHRGFVTGPADLGLSATAVDELIARTIDHYQQAGQPFEWKTRAHDLPEDLVARLLAAGFQAEPLERVMIGLAELIPPPAALAGIAVRSTTSPADLARIGELHTDVWGVDSSWLGQDLVDRLARDPGLTTVFIAEDGPLLVAAAWLTLEGQDFGGLWGGCTRAGYRGRGIYRRLVAERAALARSLGRRYLQVDASADSAPILARLGLVEVTTTTPYVWTPS